MDADGITGLVGLMRALKNEVARLGIAISVVAPGITVTPILNAAVFTESPDASARRMREAGVAVNDPEDIANAVVYLLGEGMKANGKGLLIQAGRVVNVEAGLAKSRAIWMGNEQLNLFRGKGSRGSSGKL